MKAPQYMIDAETKKTYSAREESNKKDFPNLFRVKSSSGVETKKKYKHKTFVWGCNEKSQLGLGHDLRNKVSYCFWLMQAYHHLLVHANTPAGLL